VLSFRRDKHYLDERVLAIWVIAADPHKDANQKVARVGAVVQSAETDFPIQHPCLAVLNTKAQIMLNDAAEMGFASDSRSQVTVDLGER